MKNKNVAAFLSMFFGMMGVHRFYLGQRFLGFIYLTLFFIGLAMMWDNEFPFIMIPAIAGFIDFVLLVAMPNEEFDDRYNVKRSYDRNIRSRKSRVAYDTYKEQGIYRFRSGNYEGAVESFYKSLKDNGDNPAIHFNLACCFSVLQEPEDAFFHLEKAIDHGFDALGKVHTHPSLKWLRTRPEFASFVENNYRMLKTLPEPQSDLLAAQPAPPKAVEENQVDDTIEKILQLGELKNKGILTQAEFEKQKQKILGK